MRIRVAELALVVILLMSFTAILARAAPSQPHDADAMWVEPSSVTFDTINGTLGNRFNVTVWLNMTEDIFAWQVGMLYNRTQLKCTRSAFTGGATSNYFAGHSTNAPPPTIDTSFLGNGSILASESCLGDDNVTGPQSGSLMWAEFQVLAVPTAGNLTSTFDITKKYPATTWVKDPTLVKITITTYDAAYEFIGPSGPGPLSASISPSSASVTVNQIQLFSSTVSGGTPPYTYQWFLNNTAVSGATSNSWTFSSMMNVTYTVYLNVTDQNGTVAESNTAVVTVTPQTPPPPSGVLVEVDIEPQTLNLRSHGKWITCHIELPRGYNVADVNVSTIMLNETIPAEPKPVCIRDYPRDCIPEHARVCIPDLMVKFDRAAVTKFILSEGLTTGNVTLTVTGNFTDGTPFQGSDVITVRMPGDVNCDRVVDGGDNAIVAKAFGSYGFDWFYPGSPPHPRWKGIADENEDNVIDGNDIALLARNFGKAYP